MAKKKNGKKEKESAVPPKAKGAKKADAPRDEEQADDDANELLDGLLDPDADAGAGSPPADASKDDLNDPATATTHTPIEDTTSPNANNVCSIYRINS